MHMISSPHLPQLPAIMSQRGLGPAAIHLPTLVWEGEGILGERWPGVSQGGELQSAKREWKGATDGPRSASRRGQGISWPTSSTRAALP